jgi:hypothetical protein
MKSKAQQLAEERYPYTKDKVLQNVVINAQRAAFIAGYEADKWISVEDALPIENEDVLMAVEYRASKFKEHGVSIYVGFIDEYKGWHFGEQGEHIGPEREVKYWQPLPSPPKTK